MRRPVLALSVCVPVIGLGAAALAVPPMIPSNPVTDPYSSANVRHVGTIPVEGVGVSMEVREVEGQVRAFVSGAGGLSIYDATDTTAPELLGHLPIYNWENEDIAVSEDGSTAFLTEFTADAYLHAVDVSNPALPVITDSIVGDGPHTVVCADDPCGYLYGSGGEIFDVRDRADISRLTTTWTKQLGVGSGHNLHEDEAGYFISDTSPIVMFEQVDGDPTQVAEITRGTQTLNTQYQHNNLRPNADRYVPRAADEGLDGPLRPGELMLTNGETNFTGTCPDAPGAFSTWSIAGWDQGAEMQQLDVLRPVSGEYDNGDPAVNAMGCSGHWFTETDALDGSVLVAGAWYEHGTRFLKVDPADGSIEQVGFFQPVRGAASEAFLMPDADPTDGKHVVWTIDYHSGIDILEFDENAEEPTTAEVDASWLVKKGVQDVFAITSRELCKAGMEASPQQHQVMHDVTKGVAKQQGKTLRDLARLTG